MRSYGKLVFLIAVAYLLAFQVMAEAKGTWIVFIKKDQELWKIKSDGTGKKKLANLGSHTNNVVWLDLNDIVFSKDDNLWRLNLESGKVPQQLTKEGRRLTKPDEEGIYDFVACDVPIYNPWRKELYYRVIDPGTSEAWRVLELSTMKTHALPIHWLFITDADGDRLLGESSELPSNLMTFDLAQKEESRLTIGQGTWGDGQAVFSPDGKYLAFSHNMNIYLIDNESKEIRYLAGPGQMPKWSPDSGQIAFSNHQQGGAYQYDEIYVTDLSGQKKLLVSGKEYGQNASYLWLSGWTKEGEIVWTHQYQGKPGPKSWSRRDIKLINPQDGSKRILLRDADDAWPCNFQPH